NFLVCGGLSVAAAIGMRRALRTSRGSTWGPILIGLLGVGMILAAIFTADPVDGFPLGTPLGPPTTITTIGLLHFVTALLAVTGYDPADAAGPEDRPPARGRRQPRAARVRAARRRDRAVAPCRLGPPGPATRDARALDGQGRARARHLLEGAPRPGDAPA